MARARRTDPITSHVAAESLDPATLRANQNDVWRTMIKYGPMPDFILVRLYKAEADAGNVVPQSDSGIRTRRSELHRRGFVRFASRASEHGDGYVLTDTGRPAMLWEAVIPSGTTQ